MRAEHRSWSTRGTAPPYHPCMHLGHIITLGSILAPIVACSDDPPTRPEDGTVEVWGACVWDGQVVFELCEPDLVCSWNGVCSPTCSDFADCPTFVGFENECVPMEGEKICKPLCNDANECPVTGGTALICHQGYCIGD